MAKQLREILKQRFGFDGFRPGQEEAIETLLSKRRLVCIQPTGHGKSLLYQLPSLVLPGMTLVISPLLALMRDQIGQLRQRFGIPCGSINSDQDPEENQHVMHGALEGQVRILFIAPEQLDNLDVRDFLRRLKVSLIVVDEAHCISTWGHDFRPAYRAIVDAVHELSNVHKDLHLLGLTATANDRVAADILKQLTGPDGVAPQIIRHTMDRPNIALSQVHCQSMAEKLTWLSTNLTQLSGCGILYCATRENAEIIASYLNEQGIEAAAYHAGLAPERKRELQEAFIKGEPRIISATNALGMGIDKSDLRFIVHVDTPGSITAYYQEVGRAGRDGLPAKGILLFQKEDRKIQEHFIQSAQPSVADFANILSHLKPDHEGQYPPLNTIKVRTGLHPTRVTVVLAELREQGFCEKVKQGSKQVYQSVAQDGEPDLSRYKNQYQVRQGELEAMMRYGRGQVSCLMQNLRQALGDHNATACGRCSLCAPNDWRAHSMIDHADAAGHWIAHRDVVVSETRIPVMSPGFAILNGTYKTKDFANFMRGRVQTAMPPDPDLVQRVIVKALKLKEQFGIGVLVPVPSQSWVHRMAFASTIAEQLGVPVWDGLGWNPQPEARQGQLTNNDQRKNNVANRMILRENLPRNGPILVFDDYTGSGATLKEVVRCLRKKGGHRGTIAPLVVVKLKWRLGAAGFI